MPRQRDLDDEDGTIVTASAPTPPALLHRRPRTDQRLPSAAPQAPTLTEMVFRSPERALQRGLSNRGNRACAFRSGSVAPNTRRRVFDHGRSIARRPRATRRSVLCEPSRWSADREDGQPAGACGMSLLEEQRWFAGRDSRAACEPGLGESKSTLAYGCVLRGLTFDMRGGRKQAKLACGRPLDGRVRRLVED